MTVVADARPQGINIPFRPGNSLTVELTWPTGQLAGRTFTSTLGGVSLDCDVVGDSIVVEASEAQTAAVSTAAAWLLTETTGGGSNDQLIGTWSPSTDPGTPTSLTLPVAVGDVNVTVTVVSGQASILDHAGQSSAGGAHGLVVHRWAVDGWTPFSERFVVTADGVQAHTLSVAARRGRVTASAATNGNFREWFLHEDTSWPDGEISGILYAPSNWDTGPPINRPQQGFVCRAQEVPGSPGTWRAYVVWLDIAFGTSGMLANTWQADGVTLTQGTQDPGDFTGPSLNLVRRQLHIRYARRLNAFDVAQYWAAPDARSPDMWGLVNGDLVNIASMGDTSFNRTGVAVDNVSATTKLFQVTDTTANDNIDAIAAGTVDFVALRKQMFPRAMAVMLEGDDLHAKHWRPEEPEPDWGDTTHVATLTPPSAPALPSGAGLWGVLAGHVHSSSWLEYGDLTFRRR